MTLGESAGRARGNTPRAAARRRFSEQERAELTPLSDDPNYWPDDVKARRIDAWMPDIISGVGGALLALLLLGLATMSAGWVARVCYGCIVALVSLASIVVARSVQRR